VQRANLGHHLRIDREPTRRVDDQHVRELGARFRHRTLCDGDRRLVWSTRDERRADFRRQCLQLVDRGRAIDVGADDRHFLLLTLAQKAREFRDRRCLAHALKTRHKHDCGRCSG
jgi:hypothetical protein